MSVMVLEMRLRCTTGHVGPDRPAAFTASEPANQIVTPGPAS